MKPLTEEYPLYPVEPIANLQDLLRVAVRRHGDRLAIEDLNETPIHRLTYAELLDRVVRFGRALRRAGLGPRDHVAVIGENRVQWAVAYLAAVTFDFVVVPIDKSLQENEIVTVLHASDAKAVVYSEAFRDTILSHANSVRGLKVLVDMDLPARDGRALAMPEMVAAERDPLGADPFPPVDPDAVAIIVFTSGSMGRAKGVMLSQGNIAANLMGMLSMIELLPEDRFLSVLPMHHTYECTCGLLLPAVLGLLGALRAVAEDRRRGPPEGARDDPPRRADAVREDVQADQRGARGEAAGGDARQGAARRGDDRRGARLRGAAAEAVQDRPREVRRGDPDLHRRRRGARIPPSPAGCAASGSRSSRATG